MEAIGVLAGGIAHDFNNLLTAILGYCELMVSRLRDGDPVRAYAQEVRKASDKAASLTRQLLAFSRKQVLDPRVLSLSAVVSNVDGMLRRLITENIELINELDPQIGWVKADPGQVEQVLINLVVNARDAMPGGGRLRIQTAT